MLPKVLLVLCTYVISLTVQSCNDFNLPTIFADNDNPRRLLLDVTISESFVLDSNTYQEEFDEPKTFNPDESFTFTNLSEPFNRPLPSEFNQNPSEVSGYIGEDGVKVLFTLTTTSRFAVITNMSSPSAVKACSGYTFAGRIGLSNTKNGKENLGYLFMAGHNRRVLCMTANKAHITIGVGFFNYDEQEFLTKVSAIPNPDGHWVTKIDKLSIGDTQTFTNFNATISTALHGISLPSALFNAVVRTLGGKYNREDNTYSVDCEKSLNLGLEINEAHIEVPLEAYTRKTNEGCTLLLTSHEERKQIVLGQAYFLNHGVCLDYDNDEIHFHNDLSALKRTEGLKEMKGGFTYVTKKNLKL